PGVTLGPGSFIENEFIGRSTVSLRFFDLAQFKDVTTYLQKTTVTYAGNGTYHLQAKSGVLHESGLVGHTGQCQVYFTAKAAETSQNDAVSGLDVDLVFVLRDEKNADSANQTLKVLQLLRSPSLAQDLEQIPRSGLNDKVIQVTCMFPESAFDALSFDAFLPNGKPGPLPHPLDARNYTRFAEAVAG